LKNTNINNTNDQKIKQLNDELLKVKKQNLILNKKLMSFKKINNENKDLKKDLKNMKNQIDILIKRTNTPNINNNINYNMISVNTILKNVKPEKSITELVEEPLTDDEFKILLKNYPVDGLVKIIKNRFINNDLINFPTLLCSDQSRYKFHYYDEDWIKDIKLLTFRKKYLFNLVFPDSHKKAQELLNEKNGHDKWKHALEQIDKLYKYINHSDSLGLLKKLGNELELNEELYNKLINNDDKLIIEDDIHTFSDNNYLE
jgi:hypothetical protein